MTMTFVCTWGERLELEVGNAPGGLKALVAEIDAVVGPVATRNTYAKLFELDGPPEKDKTKIYAALLLTVLGHDVTVWGIDPDELPPVYRDAVTRGSRRFQEIRGDLVAA